MSTISLIGDGSQDATILSNIFIDEYMKDANDAQLKIYLYLLRMLQANSAPDISDIADKFNHTEREVLRALLYWEKCGVLALEYAADKSLCAIRLLRLSSRQQAAASFFVQPQTLPAGVTGSGSETAADAVPAAFTGANAAGSAAFGSPSVGAADGASAAFMADRVGSGAAADADCTSSVSVPAAVRSMDEQITVTGPAGSAVISVQSAPTGNVYEKPAYSLDQLKTFKEQENTAQLIFIAEQYLGRTLSPADMKSLLFFSDVLHFSDDLIDYLLQYCVERGKKDFRYIEKVAIGWAEAHVTTPAEAEGHVSRYDRTVYSVMNALGKTSSPTKNEVAYIMRWTREFGFDTDIILEACGRTVLATDRHRFAYADSILTAWYKAGVHHISDISGLDASYQKEKAAKPARTSSAAEYNRFMHNSYDFDALEKELLKN